jgi:hypothetical protein
LLATINGWRDVVNKTLPISREIVSMHAKIGGSFASKW